MYDSRAETREIFERHAQPIVRSCFDGINGTIFAYGQTAAGKTWTMLGDKTTFTHGIIPYAVHEIFRIINQKTAECSAQSSAQGSALGFGEEIQQSSSSSSSGMSLAPILEGQQSQGD